jgi:hypothetical protein
MVPVLSLWIPIVLSAVFVVSSVIHMVMRYHRNDMRKLPQEDEVMEALRRFNIPPGDYGMPNPGSMEGMKSPEFIAKMTKGPVALITVVPPGPPAMGTNLLLWFLFSLLVSVFAAYVAGHALPAGAPWRGVFRFVGCTAFAGYALALLENSIWYHRNWGTTLRSMFDGLIYAVVTAATFAWLWPPPQ